MAEKATIQRARKKRAQGKAPTTQGARKAGIALPPPPAGTQAAKKLSRSRIRRHRTGPAGHRALSRARDRERMIRERMIRREPKAEPKTAASRPTLRQQAKEVPRRLGPAARRRKAARTRRSRSR